MTPYARAISSFLDKQSRKLTQGKAPRAGMPDLERGRTASQTAGLLEVWGSLGQVQTVLGALAMVAGVLCLGTSVLAGPILCVAAAFLLPGTAGMLAAIIVTPKLLQREGCHMSAWHDHQFPEDAPAKLAALKALAKDFNWEAHIDAGAPVKPMKPLKLSPKKP